MNKKIKAKIVMVGNCPKCGKKYVRKLPIDAVACTCQNPDAVLVPLSPALLLSKREHAKFSKAAELAGVSVERLVNEFLAEGARQKLASLRSEGMKTLPQIVVTTGMIRHEPLR
jgi:hypothetical protein